MIQKVGIMNPLKVRVPCCLFVTWTLRGKLGYPEPTKGQFGILVGK